MNIKLKLKTKNEIDFDFDNPQSTVELLYDAFANGETWLIQLSLRDMRTYKTHMYPIGSIEIHDVIGLKIDIHSLIKTFLPTINLTYGKYCFLLD